MKTEDGLPSSVWIQLLSLARRGLRSKVNVHRAVILCHNRPGDMGTIAIIIHGQGFVIHEIRAALVVVFQTGVKVIDTRVNNYNFYTGSRPGSTITGINDNASKLNKMYQASSITQAASQFPQPLRFQHRTAPGPED